MQTNHKKFKLKSKYFKISNYVLNKCIIVYLLYIIYLNKLFVVLIIFYDLFVGQDTHNIPIENTFGGVSVVINPSILYIVQSIFK